MCAYLRESQSKVWIERLKMNWIIRKENGAQKTKREREKIMGRDRKVKVRIRGKGEKKEKVGKGI